jgi:hypothetical protein
MPDFLAALGIKLALSTGQRQNARRKLCPLDALTVRRRVWRGTPGAFPLARALPVFLRFSLEN